VFKKRKTSITRGKLKESFEKEEEKSHFAIIVKLKVN
jgi:hypothetical protein